MPATFDTFFPFAGQTVSNANWQQYVQMFRNDGVVTQLGGTAALGVVQNHLGADRSVDVAAGRLLCQGIFGENSTVKNLAIATNGSGSARIDTIVARIVQATPTMVLDVLQGTPAGSPVAPTLTQTASVYEVPLANIAVANGFASIVNANITDQRAWTGPAAVRLPSTASVAALNYNVYAGAPSIAVLPVSGTVNITSIPAAPAGSILILEFASAACSVLAGATLKIARTYTSAVAGTLSLQSDGAAWVEIGRGGEQFSAHFWLGNATASAAPPIPSTILAGDLPAIGAWVPGNLTQTGVLSTSGVIAHAWQANKFVWFSYIGVIGTVGTGGITILMNLPAGLTLASATNFPCIGSFVYVRTGTTNYAGSVQVQTTTQLAFIVAGNNGGLGNLPNFATANNDVLSFVCQAELA